MVKQTRISNKVLSYNKTVNFSTYAKFNASKNIKIIWSTDYLTQKYTCKKIPTGCTIRGILLMVSKIAALIVIGWKIIHK